MCRKLVFYIALPKAIWKKLLCRNKVFVSYHSVHTYSMERPLSEL